MTYKLIFMLLMFTQLNIFAKDFSKTVPLEHLNYELVKSLNPENGEPSKFYKLSFPGKTQPSLGVVIIKRMDDSFNDVPVFIEGDGTIWSVDKKEEGILGFDGGYGEKFEILLAAINKKDEATPLAKCVIIPFPRIVQDDKGHKIELQAASPDGCLFTVTGSGFIPKEKVSIASRSCDESMTFSVEVDDNGNFHLGTAPAVIGKTEGPFELVFTGKDMKPLKMRHYWGEIAFYKPNSYKELRNKYKFTN